MRDRINKTYISIFISLLMLLTIYGIAQSDFPPSPAGGKSLDLSGGKQGYYYAEDINNCFDDEFLKNGMTIEFWFCPARPVKKGEGWKLISKIPIYEIEIAYWSTVDEEWMSIRHSTPGGGGAMGFYDLSKAKDYSPEWHHYIFQGNASGNSFYGIIFLDGVSKGNFSTGSSDFVMDSDYPFCVGNVPEGSKTSVFVEGKYIVGDLFTFDGLIDEIRISNIQRYEQKAPWDTIDIQNRFDPDEHTVALWHFDEAIGSLQYGDASGNGHTLFAAGQLAVINGKSKIPSLWGVIKAQKR